MSFLSIYKFIRETLLFLWKVVTGIELKDYIHAQLGLLAPLLIVVTNVYLSVSKRHTCTGERIRNFVACYSNSITHLNPYSFIITMPFQKRWNKSLAVQSWLGN